MKKKIEISIESPCRENHKKFRATSVGGYCQKCQKEVIDFTGYKNSELYSYFDTQTGSVCGKFRPEQLGTITEPKNSTFLFSRIAAASLGLLSIISAKPTLSQNINKDLYSFHADRANSQKKPTSNTQLQEEKIEVAGVVIESTANSPLPGATILIKGTERGSVSDLSGKFMLQLTEDEISKTVLTISFIGYVTKEVLASEIGRSPIILEVDEESLSEVVVVGGACYKRPFPSNVWYWITKPFRK